MKIVKILLVFLFIMVLILLVNVKEMLLVGGILGNFIVFVIQEMILDNGLKVIFIFYGSIFKVIVRLVINIGNIDDGEKVWLVDLSFDMLCQGIDIQFVKVLVEVVVSMGGEIVISVGMDFSFIGMDVFGEFILDVVDVLVDMVMNVSFVEVDLVWFKIDSQCNFVVQKFSFFGIVIEVFYQLIYGNYFYG